MSLLDLDIEGAVIFNYIVDLAVFVHAMKGVMANLALTPVLVPVSEISDGLKEILDAPLPDNIPLDKMNLVNSQFFANEYSAGGQLGDINSVSPSILCTLAREGEKRPGSIVLLSQFYEGA